jgi:hypothetical protein
MTQTRAPGQKGGTPKPPPQSTGSIRLTGRGAVVALFAVSFFGLLIAAWTGWSEFADVVFVMTCGVVTCYTRPGGLRTMVVCPPLAFFAGSVLAEVLTAPDGFSVAERTLVTLGSSAPWLFTGTALTIAIALGRGYRPEMPAVPLIRNLGEAVRGAWPDRWSRPARGDRWLRRR